MAKFRKKPLVIEANQWSESEPLALPGVHKDRYSNAYYVVTIHGEKAYLRDRDWVLPEPQEGRFYPCKPDIFAATYEPEDEDITDAMFEQLRNVPKSAPAAVDAADPNNEGRN